jgi:hypothetical protein
VVKFIWVGCPIDVRRKYYKVLISYRDMANCGVCKKELSFMEGFHDEGNRYCDNCWNNKKSQVSKNNKKEKESINKKNITRVRRKQSKLLNCAGVLFIIAIFLMYTAYQSDQEYKMYHCAFPTFDSVGNAIYPEGCHNPSSIDTSKNWTAVLDRGFAGILSLISLVLFGIWRVKNSKKKKGRSK